MIHFSLAPVVMVLLAAVITVIICRRLRIPPILGYLVVGFIVGPSILGIIPQTEATHFLGEIGIVFLMFSIGLEFSLSKLKSMRRLVLGLGGMQVLLTMLMIWLVLVATGSGLASTFAVAGALAMSSTAIVSRLLSEKTELGHPHGKMVMGVLLMQDIAVVPLMILLPALAGGQEQSLWLALGLAFVKMVVTLGILLFIGNRLVTPWFRLVAKGNSSELFMINVLLVTLGVAYLTELTGLSLALGAFVAGMLISETEYRFQVEDDIRPFRDALLAFFFITIGMKLDIHLLTENWQLALILLLLLIPLKGAVIYAISKRMQYASTDSLKTALYLAQGGEFGFVLLAISGNLNLLSIELEQAAITAILLSMIIAPFIINSNKWIVRKLIKNTWDKQSVDLHHMLAETMGKNEHILIIGFGRCGQGVARLLAQENIAYYVLDLDAERVASASAAGEPIAFGDAKRKEVLQAAGLKRAKMVLVTLHNMHETQHVINTIMTIDPTMSVVVRVTDEDYIQMFNKMGADDIVSDTKEVGLVMAGQAMANVGFSYQKIHDILSEIRKNHYQILVGLFAGQDDPTRIDDEYSRIQRYAFTLPENAYIIGKSISELPLEKMQLKLLSIRRQTRQITQLTDDLTIHSQDTLVLLGARDKINSFENWSLQGEL